jgi:hypothetical protein
MASSVNRTPCFWTGVCKALVASGGASAPTPLRCFFLLHAAGEQEDFDWQSLAHWLPRRYAIDQPASDAVYIRGLAYLDAHEAARAAARNSRRLSITAGAVMSRTRRFRSSCLIRLHAAGDQKEIGPIRQRRSGRLINAVPPLRKPMRKGLPVDLPSSTARVPAPSSPVDFLLLACCMQEEETAVRSRTLLRRRQHQLVTK